MVADVPAERVGGVTHHIGNSTDNDERAGLGCY